ncbi:MULTISPECIES: hypothetical protein [Streptomyces]|uniref:Uncharacterized protein n=1 Tax=Streptomyces mutomycini TaxID=284036 RepID=A0ABW0B4Q7_9ACTN|nr:MULTISPECIES: hypothetical protein [Streptomyces]KPC81122.1 hypothetical protein ADK82_19730 [Streptomyces sp. NRRL S-4]
MTTFVITVPGTFVVSVTESLRASLKRKLAAQHTDLSKSEGLDLLTLNDDNTFSVRLEVNAADRYEAELSALGLMSKALRETGFAQKDALLGTPAVTGVDSPI